MDKIKVNKSNLESQITSLKRNISSLNQSLNDLKNSLNGVSSHSEFDVTSACSSIASSVTGLSKDYEIEGTNLHNYVSSMIDIDEKDPTENVVSISATAMQVSSMKDVTFNLDYQEEYKNPANISGSHLDFINSIVPGAIETYEKYGVLPSLTLAQAILESGWGESGLSANYNNLFGIKAGSSWTGKVANLKTSEQNSDGSYVQITAGFRAYDSVADSIEDHAKLLTNDRYKKVIASTNYRDACVAVREAGYATSLNYSNSLISLIEKYGLNQWDPKTS